MKNLIDFFNLIEISRNQPQYGYGLWGGNVRMGNLAEHHYAVAMIALYLAKAMNARGAKLDIGKVAELALIHDLGELFGGDIGMAYARVNPVARAYAKKFEAENNKFIGNILGEGTTGYMAAAEDISDPKTDEARVVKIADYLEVTHYKLFIGKFGKADVDLVRGKLDAMIEGVKDMIAKRYLVSFISRWKNEMKKNDLYSDLILSILAKKQGFANK